MVYRVRISEEAQAHLRFFSRPREVVALAAVAQLVTEPAVEATNRKPMARNPLLATWELRVGDIRVYYDVNEAEGTVEVLGFGEKVRERVRIGGVFVRLREGMRVDVSQEPGLIEALERLETFAREHPHEPVILTRDDRPVGAYVPLGALDEEALMVSVSPVFRAMAARSRGQHRRGEAQSLEEVLRERGITEYELEAALQEVSRQADQQ